MQPAADAMAEALDGISIRQPVVPLVANVTAAQVIDPDTVRAQLVEQVTAMVRWRESVLYMKDQGVETLIEVGAGKVLSGLARRIDRELTGKSLQQPGDFDDIIKEL
jgi:[acyl-carrier-protein] S-malonyltransferase